MEFRQLHCIGQVFVKAQVSNIPYDICPRIEIAAPEKILAIPEDRVGRWQHVDIYESKFLFKYINFTERYISYATPFTCNGFYVLTTDPDMFYTTLDMRYNDEEYLYDWLLKWAEHYFIMTSPIINSSYSVSNGHNLMIPISPTEGVVQQLIDNNCYTLCNGFTLFIALTRLGIIADDVFITVSRRLFELENNYGEWYAHIPDEYFNIYIANPMPQISEFPFLYACMGKNKASRRVTDTLNAEYHFRDRAFMTSNIPSLQVVYYTSQLAAGLPYIRASDADYYRMYHDDAANIQNDIGNMERNKLDVGGLLRNIVATRRMWKKCGPQIIKRIIESFQTQKAALSFLFKRLFQIYSEPNSCPRSRVRRIWNHIVSIYPFKIIQEWLYNYLHIYYNKITINSASWVPEPPIAFLMDVATNVDDLYDKVDKQPSFMDILRAFDCNTPIGRFASIIEQRVSLRLKALKRACKNYSAWGAMQMFLRQHPSYLYT